MNKGIYIATLEPNSGKSIVSLGLMRTLLGKTAKVGYFRPIIDDSKNTGKDNHISTVLSFFDIKLDYEDAYAFTSSELIKKRNKGKSGEIYNIGNNKPEISVLDLTKIICEIEAGRFHDLAPFPEMV